MGLGRPVFRSPLRHFIWVDSSFVYMVSPEAIKFAPVNELQRVTATHIHDRNNYIRSNVKLRLKRQTEQFQLLSKWSAEELVMFLNAAMMLRGIGGNKIAMKDSPLEVIGAVA